MSLHAFAPCCPRLPLGPPLRQAKWGIAAEAFAFESRLVVCVLDLGAKKVEKKSKRDRKTAELKTTRPKVRIA